MSEFLHTVAMSTSSRHAVKKAIIAPPCKAQLLGRCKFVHQVGTMCARAHARYVCGQLLDDIVKKIEAAAPLTSSTGITLLPDFIDDAPVPLPSISLKTIDDYTVSAGKPF